MRRGDIWVAHAPGGDRPVLVLTRDPVGDRIGVVVVAAITWTARGLVSELPLAVEDGVPTACFVNFDNLHTLQKSQFRRKVATLTPARMAQACRAMRMRPAVRRGSVHEVETPFVPGWIGLVACSQEGLLHGEIE